MVQKVLTGTAITQLARDLGIPVSTIHSWKTRKNDKITGPYNYSIEKKYELVIESKKVKSDDFGEWLRKKGIHSDHLTKWESEIKEEMTDSKYKKENKILKDKLKEVQKDLDRKDKALSATAALLVLKKKYQHFWEDEEK